MNTRIIFALFSLLYLISCTKQITKQTAIPTGKKPTVYYIEGDTTHYFIGFSDKKQKISFQNNLETFLKQYPFDSIYVDTINNYFSISIIPETKRIFVDTSDKRLTKPKKIDTVETEIEAHKKITEEDTTDSKYGGSATIYTHRKFIDNTIAELIQVTPFSINSKNVLSQPNDKISSDFLTVKQISPVNIRIMRTDNLINSSGQALTAFDIVQAWTDFIKSNPAEGFFIFYNVKGIRKFIKGEEAIIQGFSIIDENTIQLSLSKPDPSAIQRLHSKKLLPVSLNIGQFYIKSRKGNKIIFTNNKLYPLNKSFLTKCTIICGGDKNPIVSYSLNKYDIATLYKKKDIEYCSKSLLNNSNLIPFSTDRYFISLGSKSINIRQFLKQLIDPVEIQINAVKSKGELIIAIESNEQTDIPIMKSKAVDNPNIQKPICILYNSDDPVSINIAEKIYSDLSHSGISSTLKGLKKASLEIALIDRNYDIAIGWVPDKILTNQNEQLRLATIWFNNELNETKRITNYFEIPLFIVNHYALCKKYIKFYKNQFGGIYRETE